MTSGSDLINVLNAGQVTIKNSTIQTPYTTITVTIAATKAGNNLYNAATASYNLVINRANVTFNDFTVNGSDVKEKYNAADDNLVIAPTMPVLSSSTQSFRNVSLIGHDTYYNAISTDGANWTSSISVAKGTASVIFYLKKNDGSITNPYTFNIDSDIILPNAPVINTLTNLDSTITGTAEANATVTLTLPGELGTKTATVGNDGKWSITLDSLLTGGADVSATTTDSYGNTSEASTKTVIDTTITVSVQPQSKVVVGNQSTTLNVTASSSLILTYQWYFKGDAINGATQSNYTISLMRSVNAGDYTVVVSNTYVHVKSDKATLTVDWGNVDGDVGTTVTHTADGVAQVTVTDITNIGSSNVSIETGKTTIIIPASIISGLTKNDITTVLKLEEKETPQEIKNNFINFLKNAIVTSIDIDLTKYFSDGSHENVHQLDGTIKIVLDLSDEQLAKITDVNKARLYYFNKDMNKLELVEAAFNLTAKTVTFYTNHLSTYVIANDTVQTTITNPQTGDNSPLIIFAMIVLSTAGFVVIMTVAKKKIKR